MSGIQNIGLTPRRAYQSTVPLPRSLTELQQAAALQFKHSGCVRVYKDGREVHQSSAVRALIDGDSLTVRLTDPRSFPRRSTPVRTTHQADFVQFAAAAETAKPTLSDDMSVITEDAMGKPFEGSSSYAQDFRRASAYERQKPSLKAMEDHFPSTGGLPVETSTYAEQFSWMPYSKQPPAGSDENSVLTAASKGHKFTAKSNYTENFVPRRQAFARKVEVNDNDSTLTNQILNQPFCSRSSYQQHFVHHSLADGGGKQPSARPVRGVATSLPFGGNSEYRNQFIQNSERTPRLHLKLIQD